MPRITHIVDCGFSFDGKDFKNLDELNAYLLSKEVKPEEVFAPDVDTEKIEKLKSLGYSDEDIKAAFKRKGIAEEKVNEILSQTKTEENAKTVRGDQGQLSEGGETPESSQERSGGDLQQTQANESKPSETEQQAGQKEVDGEPPTGKPPTAEGEKQFPTGRKLEESVGKTISTSKNLTAEEKNAYAEKNWNYFQRSHEAAAKIAKEITDKYGIDGALEVARSGSVRGDVQTMIYGETWTRCAENARAENLSAEEKQQWADKEADIVAEASKLGYESGITSSAFGYLYKRSPLGLVKSYGKFIRDARDTYLSAHDEKLKSAYDALVQDYEHLTVQNKVLTDAVNKRKGIINKENQKKIDDFFDKLKAKKDVSYSTIIPPQVWNGAVETMRLVAKGTSAAADVIKAGVDYINERVKEGFDADKFKQDILPHIQSLVGETKDSDWDKVVKSLEPSERKQTEKEVNKYADTIRKIKRLGSEDRNSLLQTVMGKLNKEGLITDEDLAAYGNNEKSLTDLMQELGDKNRDKVIGYLNQTVDRIQVNNQLKGISDDAKQKETAIQKRILEKWGNKLKMLSGDDQANLLKNSLGEIVSKGALDYDSFKQMFADVLGMPKLDEATKNKLIELAKAQNNAADLADKLKKDLDNEALLNQYIDAKGKAEEAAIEQQKLFSRPQGLYDKFLWGIRMNTLSVLTQGKALVGNITTLLPRTLSGSATSLSDMMISKIPFANNWFGDNPLDKTNYFLSAGNIPKAFSDAAKKSIRELYTGVYSKNIGTNEFTKTSPVHPVDTYKKLYDYWINNKGHYSPKQLAGMVYDGSAGAFAEMMARLINFTHNTFGERQGESVKEMIGKQMGLQGTALKSFMELPNEEAQPRIENEAKRATFQQDNILTNILKGITKEPAGKPTGAQTGFSKFSKTALAVTLPFPRFAMNAFTYGLELASPEYAFIRAIEKGYKKDRPQFNYYMGQAVTGLALRYVIFPALVSNGIFSPAANFNDQKKRQMPEGGMPPAHINLSGMFRMLRGENPLYQNGDFTVDAKWLGMLGEEGVMMSDKYRDMSKQAADAMTYPQQLYYDAGYQFQHLMTEGVLSGAFNGMQSLTDGQRGLNDFAQSSTGMLMNSIYPQTVYQGITIIRDSPKPIITDYEDKGFYGMVTNTSKTALNTVFDRFGIGNLPAQVSETGQPIQRKSAYQTAAGRNTVYEWQYKLANLYDKSDNGKGKKDETFLPEPLQHSIEIHGFHHDLNNKEYSEYKQKVNTLRSTVISAAQSQDQFMDGDDPKRIKKMLQHYYEIGRKEAKADFIKSHPQFFTKESKE